MQEMGQRKRHTVMLSEKEAEVIELWRKRQDRVPPFSKALRELALAQAESACA